MASMLYFNGVDSVSISKRLGHAQVSTTANIYAHVIEAADQKNADILADVFLKKAWILKASWIKVEFSRFWQNPTIWKSNEKSLDSNESRLYHGCGDRIWTCDLRVMSSVKCVKYRFTMWQKVLKTLGFSFSPFANVLYCLAAFWNGVEFLLNSNTGNKTHLKEIAVAF